MGTTWTQEQRNVIEFRNCNILVSAAAGSGKTAVLVERILSMLMDEKNPVDIDHLLIVTFTNAAAGEMKERIRMAIDRKLEEELDQRLEEHLQKQITLLGNAQISTIHSFCQYVIRNYFHTIDLDPNFRIADEGEQKLLESDVMERLLEDRYMAGEEDFLRMTESLSTGKDDHRMEEIIRKLFRFSTSFPDPQKWLKEREQDFEISTKDEFLALPWVNLLMEQCREYLTDIRAQIEYAILVAGEVDGPYMYLPMLEDDQRRLEFLEEQSDFCSLAEAFASLGKTKTLSSKKDTAVAEEKKELVKLVRKQYKTRLEELRKEYFYAEVEEHLLQLKRQRPVMKTLLELVIEFSRRFSEEKRKRNLCDFNDLEHLALQILQQDSVAGVLAEYYTEILIDEYQDSNLVQEIILKSISKEKDGIYNMFMVGDVKQSIYRFRLARPELFMEKYESYSLTEGVCRRIDLHKNFRSRSQVLDSVNDIFDVIMKKNLGNVEYDEAARLNVGAVFEEVKEEQFRSEALVLKLSKEEVLSEEEGERELEARMIGKRILELLNEQQVWDKEEKRYRKAEFQDMVILLRTISGWSEVFVKTLQNMGIPSFAGSRTGYFSAPEVQTILALLKIIDNPCQDIPLTAVLYSPIGRCDGKRLTAWKREGTDAFYEKCRKDEELSEFFGMLDEFRKLAAYTPMHELLRRIYEITGYENYVTCMPGGEQRRANLEMLVEKAAAYESGSYHGLYNFIRYIENLHKYEVDFGEAETLAGNSNMVRIMSIHKSKGLEFPIVFVAGMGKTINQMDSRDFCVTHADYGIAADEVDPLLRVKRKTLFKNVLKKQIKHETLGEELRVLYVALTRAKEKLILSGVLKHAEETMEKYLTRISGASMSFSDRSGATTYWDWVLPVILNMTEQGSFERKEITIRDLILEEKGRQEKARQEKDFWKTLPTDYGSDSKAAARLEDLLEYEYPYLQSGEIPSKVSVSELKSRWQEDAQDAHEIYQIRKKDRIVPQFLKKNQELTGAGKGTLYHKMMECLDFSGNAEEELIRLTANGTFSQEEALVIEPVKIQNFLKTNLGIRMQKAQERGELFRERQFVIERKADFVCPKWGSEESILIQGIIDAYFIEEGQIILVDYKTDRVDEKDASSLYEKYKVQLECYKQALESLTDQKVTEVLLYSFYLDTVLSEKTDSVTNMENEEE